MSDPHRGLVRRGYDVLGPRYHDWSAANDPRHRLTYLDHLQAALAGRARVVELGCGPGRPVAQRLVPGHDYTGVDVSEGQLALAREAVPGARFVRADMRDVAFVPGSLDAVAAFYSVIHLPREDHAGLFGRVASWLRPGGIFAASLGAADNPGSSEAWIDGVEMFWSHFDAPTNLRLLAEAGLRPDRHEVLADLEDGREARFLWVVAVRG